MHLGLDGHVTLKWGMESEPFQLNQLLYIISYIFFTLFMPKSEAQLKKEIVMPLLWKSRVRFPLDLLQFTSL